LRQTSTCLIAAYRTYHYPHKPFRKGSAQQYRFQNTEQGWLIPPPFQAILPKG